MSQPNEQLIENYMQAAEDALGGAQYNLEGDVTQTCRRAGIRTNQGAPATDFEGDPRPPRRRQRWLTCR